MFEKLTSILSQLEKYGNNNNNSKLKKVKNIKKEKNINESFNHLATKKDNYKAYNQEKMDVLDNIIKDLKNDKKRELKKMVLYSQIMKRRGR
ncbi:MAG: hypothetical protein Q4B52_02270 [Tissierellia bacterium]|nr:hypothetical protein [Tissierellia bacterium]